MKEMGVCYAHEHLWIDSPIVREEMPEYHLNDLNLAIQELQSFRAAGGQTCMDAMPGDAGRGLAQLAQLSQITGTHIVASTGAHLAKYYEKNHWSFHESSEAMAQQFITEIETGEIKTGLIKVASGEQWTDRERKTFEAAAQAHQKTGAPILTHTEQGLLALEQAALFQKEGVKLSHVVLSHTDRTPDIGYHREILSTGVCVEYDSAFRWKEDRNPTRDLILQLIPEFPGQILLGMDAARKSYWKSCGGTPGLDYLLTDFKRVLMQRGLSESQWTNIMIHNPAAAYSFRSRF